MHPSAEILARLPSVRANRDDQGDGRGRDSAVMGQLKAPGREMQLQHERLKIRLETGEPIVNHHAAAVQFFGDIVDTLAVTAGLPAETIERTDQVQKTWDELNIVGPRLEHAREEFVAAAVALVGAELGKSQGTRWLPHRRPRTK